MLASANDQTESSCQKSVYISRRFCNTNATSFAWLKHQHLRSTHHANRTQLRTWTFKHEMVITNKVILKGMIIYLQIQSNRCPICSYVDNNPRQLRSHVLTHLDAKNDYMYHRGDEAIRCSICGKEFRTSMEYLAHEYHACEKTCTSCGKSFVQ